MQINYTISNNGSVYPLFQKIGNTGEKGVNVLKFDIKNASQDLNCYLVFWH